MRRRFLILVSLSAGAIIADASSVLARGFFRRRCRPQACCPPTPPKRAAKTVEDLATLLVSLKGQINAVSDPMLQAELDDTLAAIMGDPNTIFAALSDKVINQNQRVSKNDVANFFRGEVLDISRELRRLAAGQGG